MCSVVVALYIYIHGDKCCLSGDHIGMHMRNIGVAMCLIQLCCVYFGDVEKEPRHSEPFVLIDTPTHTIIQKHIEMKKTPWACTQTHICTTQESSEHHSSVFEHLFSVCNICINLYPSSSFVLSHLIICHACSSFVMSQFLICQATIHNLPCHNSDKTFGIFL